MTTTLIELRRDIYLSMLVKSGVREWLDADANQQLWEAAILAADGLNEVWEEVPTMAVTAVFRQQSGTAKVVKNSGGDAAITLASLANAASPATSAGARQSVKLDFGATRAEMWRCKATFEIAATPTAGNVIDIYLSPSDSATAGTDNAGNCTGADAAYTGYSNNIDAAAKQLFYVGSFVVTAQATTTVQAGFVGRFSPPSRYASVVVINRSGVALHSTDTNQAITFTPEEGTSEPS
jgi:hypothetical protein